jgi:hypothetical protein
MPKPRSENFKGRQKKKQEKKPVFVRTLFGLDFLRRLRDFLKSRFLVPLIEKRPQTQLIDKGNTLDARPVKRSNRLFDF